MAQVADTNRDQAGRTSYAGATAGNATSQKQGTANKRRLLVLLHGEKANDSLVRDAIARLRSEGYPIMIRVTYEAGDVDRLVQETLTLGTADTLVAAGGDGTVCEVVAALLKHTGGLKDTRDVPAMSGQGGAAIEAQAQGQPPAVSTPTVAILPMGTSNDFAATTGIPEDPYEALKMATTSDSIRALDVGMLNGQIFMNTATIGASADIGKMTSSKIKKILGPAAFLLTSVKAARNWMPVPSVLSFPNDGKGDNLASMLSGDLGATDAKEVKPESSERQEPAGAPDADGDIAGSQAAAKNTREPVGQVHGVPLLHVTAANNRQIASMVAIAPNALLDDGLLDCVYVTGAATEKVKNIVWSVLRKGLKGTKVAPTLLRVPWLEVATEKPLEWSIDGEPQPEPTNKFRFSLLHRAVKFHLPDDRVLVAGQPMANDEHGKISYAAAVKKSISNPSRIPRGKLHPPSLRDMLSNVVRFRKKKDWAKIIRSGITTTIKTVIVAGVGATAVHYWHTRNDPTRSLRADARRTASHMNDARKRVTQRGRRHTAIA